MTTHELDRAKVEAFAGKMLGVLNEASLAFITSIGHQTGLLDTLAGLPPSTSEQISRAAGLNERYVREWLGAMVTGRIIDYDPVGDTYMLPSEHAASLTRAAGVNNLAAYMTVFACLGNVEQDIVECFRKGGGVPYSAYPRFMQLWAGINEQRLDTTLIETVLPLVPGLAERLHAGIDLAEIGCGFGHAINLMARAFPNSRFTGYDLSEEGIAVGREEAERMGLSNVRFEVKDAATLEVSAQYDVITAFDTIHDQAQPRKVLRMIFNALRPDGIFLMADLAASSNVGENLEHPVGPFVYMNSLMHCVPVSLALGGEGLGAMWGEQKARQLLAGVGFTRIEVKQAPGDMLNNYFIALRG